MQKEGSKHLPTRRTRGQCKGLNGQSGGQEHLLRDKAGEAGTSQGTKDFVLHGKWATGSHLKAWLSDLDVYFRQITHTSGWESDEGG